ncbi:MAG: twin-arginine translocation signal domain-containing protein, partial [Halobacteriales archaeon]|nr:twin-arginine translocation signal domain-containing protein [Halobacteriales archaeon]
MAAADIPRDEPLDLPPEKGISRRSFVKGCIYGSAAAVAVGGAAFALPPLAILSS